ncbi:hypothetical protein EI94DRAFT_1706456 [Lactarius quietus]|nr:hypothetical protein EI94DRAFT_1706456 [Lactarius quietus]
MPPLHVRATMYKWAIDDDKQPAVDSVDDSDSAGDGMTISLLQSQPTFYDQRFTSVKLKHDKAWGGGGLETVFIARAGWQACEVGEGGRASHRHDIACLQSQGMATRHQVGQTKPKSCNWDHTARLGEVDQVEGGRGGHRHDIAHLQSRGRATKVKQGKPKSWEL